MHPRRQYLSPEACDFLANAARSQAAIHLSGGEPGQVATKAIRRVAVALPVLCLSLAAGSMLLDEQPAHALGDDSLRQSRPEASLYVPEVLVNGERQASVRDFILPAEPISRNGSDRLQAVDPQARAGVELMLKLAACNPAVSASHVADVILGFASIRNETEAADFLDLARDYGEIAAWSQSTGGDPELAAVAYCNTPAGTAWQETLADWRDATSVDRDTEISDYRADATNRINALHDARSSFGNLSAQGLTHKVSGDFRQWAGALSSAGQALAHAFGSPETARSISGLAGAAYQANSAANRVSRASNASGARAVSEGASALNGILRALDQGKRAVNVQDRGRLSSTNASSGARAASAAAGVIAGTYGVDTRQFRHPQSQSGHAYPAAARAAIPAAASGGDPFHALLDFAQARKLGISLMPVQGMAVPASHTSVRSTQQADVSAAITAAKRNLADVVALQAYVSRTGLKIDLKPLSRFYGELAEAALQRDPQTWQALARARESMLHEEHRPIESPSRSYRQR